MSERSPSPWDDALDGADPSVLARLQADADASVALPADLWARVQADVAAGGWRDRLVSLPSSVRLALAACGALLAAAVLIGLQGVRADLDGSGWLRFVGVSLPLLAIAISALALAVRSRAAPLVPYGPLAALGAFGVLLAAGVLSFPGVVGVPLAAHVHCCLVTALATLGVAAWVAVLERDPRPAPARVALGAVGAGAWAFVAQSVFCPGVDVAHLLVGHGMSAAVVALLGAGVAAVARR